MNLTGRAWLTLENGTVVPLFLDYCSFEHHNEWIPVTTVGDSEAKYIPAYSRLKLNLQGSVLGPLELATMPVPKDKEEQEEKYAEFIRHVEY